MVTAFSNSRLSVALARPLRLDKSFSWLLSHVRHCPIRPQLLDGLGRLLLCPINHHLVD